MRERKAKSGELRALGPALALFDDEPMILFS